MTTEERKALLDKADEHNNKGNYDEAERLAQQVISETPLEKPESGLIISKNVELHCSALLLLADSARRKSDFDRTLTFARAALTRAEEHNLPEIKAKAWNICGIVYRALGNYDKAFEYYAKALAAHEELGTKSGAARVLGNIGSTYFSLGNFDKALEYFITAFAVHEEIGEKAGIASATGNIGNVYLSIGTYDKALEYYAKALAAHEELGGKPGAALVTGNIGSVYFSLNSFDKALEYYTRALAAYEEIGEKSGVASFTGAIGLVHASLGNYDKALEYYGKALDAKEEIGEESGVAIIMGNIGIAYASLGNFDKALEYYGKALATHEELGEKPGVARVTGTIGSLYAIKKFEGYDAAKAGEFLLKALALSAEVGAKVLLIEFHKSLADLYENEKRWEDSLFHHKKHIELRDEVQSEEAKKKADLMEQQRQAAEREKQIAIAKAAADAKHKATEQLLHNVLPPSIAEKMLDGTKLIAEKLPAVSVLFADIVNFTKLSQRISPEELVEGLDTIFSEFDALAGKHGLEKIKTIGDAYMVVSGAPVPRADHAEAMAQFALEMLEAMKQFRSISTGEEIQLRIGIHSGEVVAGVIGKKKFAYDLWGDAVNTAARMESHGEAGKIHCSEDFVRSVGAHELPLRFVERGEIDIKGKGMMTTHFLEKV